MAKSSKRDISLLATSFLLLSLIGAACENIALVGRSTPTIDGDEVVGEIIGIDIRRNEIFLRSEERASGRASGTRTIHYDSTTQVIQRGRDYPVSALKLGDRVAMQVWQRDRGMFASLILLRQEGRDAQP